MRCLESGKVCAVEVGEGETVLELRHKATEVLRPDTPPVDTEGLPAPAQLLRDTKDAKKVKLGENTTLVCDTGLCSGDTLLAEFICEPDIVEGEWRRDVSYRNFGKAFALSPCRTWCVFVEGDTEGWYGGAGHLLKLDLVRGITRTVTTRAVTCIALTSLHIVCAFAEDCSVEWLDSATFKSHRTKQTLAGRVWMLSASENSNHVLASTDKGMLVLGPVSEDAVPGRTYLAVLSPCGGWVATSCNSYGIMRFGETRRPPSVLWDMKSVVLNIPFKAPLFSPDSRLLAVYYSKELRVYGTARRNLVRKFRHAPPMDEDNDYIVHITFSACSRYIFSSTRSSVVRWDVLLSEGQRVDTNTIVFAVSSDMQFSVCISMDLTDKRLLIEKVKMAPNSVVRVPRKPFEGCACC